MFQNYLAVALRNLIKHKLYSAINIIGLAVGLAACILITLFVRDEFTYDTQWANAERIYRLNTTFALPGREPFITTQAPGPAKEALKRYFPDQVEQAGRIAQMYPVVRVGDQIASEEVAMADPEFVDIVDLPTVSGSLKAALSDNSSIAITETFARRYFDSEDAQDKVITLTYYGIERDFRVAAVLKDLPHNTVLKLQAMIMIDEQDFIDNPWLFTEWTSVNTYQFFKLAPGAQIEQINSRLKAFTDDNIVMPAAVGIPGPVSDLIHFSTQRLLDVQLHPHAPNGGEMKATGSMDNVLLFAAIAALILTIACINFMNLATAKSTQRAKEVALRKVLGASRHQLVTQFIGESLLLAVLGMFLGVVLVELLLPAFGNYVDKVLAFDYADLSNWGLLLGLVAVVGLVGGAYPALVLSGFQPARVLKANKSAETRGSVALRNGLVVVQFAISVALIIATLMVFGQKQFLLNMDPGYNKENLLVINNMSRNGAEEKRELLRERIAALPGVVSASLHGDAPISGNESNRSVRIPGDDSQQMFLIGVQNVDENFLNTYQIPLLAGRDYDRQRPADGVPNPDAVTTGEKGQGTLIVNESALKRLGFGAPEQALGRVVEVGVGGTAESPVLADLTIIGVIPDIHFQSLRRVVRPEMYFLDRNYYGNLSVRYSGDTAGLLRDIEALWREETHRVPFQHQFVDERMAGEFEGETRQSTLLGIFAGLAIVIACLGLYGLASFTAERRTKEIGIRKVMGARVRDIVQLLLWQFSKPVLLANIIAWPLACWGVINWLQQFPYRLDTWVLLPVCLGAGLLALSIAWLTVGGNAARVARANPIKALRYE